MEAASPATRRGNFTEARTVWSESSLESPLGSRSPLRDLQSTNVGHWRFWKEGTPLPGSSSRSTRTTPFWAGKVPSPQSLVHEPARASLPITFTACPSPSSGEAARHSPPPTLSIHVSRNAGSSKPSSNARRTALQASSKDVAFGAALSGASSRRIPYPDSSMSPTKASGQILPSMGSAGPSPLRGRISRTSSRGSQSGYSDSSMSPTKASRQILSALGAPVWVMGSRAPSTGSAGPSPLRSSISRTSSRGSQSGYSESPMSPTKARKITLQRELASSTARSYEDDDRDSLVGTDEIKADVVMKDRTESPQKRSASVTWVDTSDLISMRRYPSFDDSLVQDKDESVSSTHGFLDQEALKVGEGRVRDGGNANRAPDPEDKSGDDESNAGNDDSLEWVRASLQVSSRSRKEESSRRRFHSQSRLDTDSLFNVSENVLASEVPASLRNSRLASIARNRAETIGDSSGATSLNDSVAKSCVSGNSSASLSGPSGAHEPEQGHAKFSFDDVANGACGSVPVTVTSLAPEHASAIGSGTILNQLAEDWKDENDRGGRSMEYILRWNAHVNRLVLIRGLHSWQLYTCARLLALSKIFRVRWAAWRKVVTGLSARRRLAIYVLSTRLRLSHAFETLVFFGVQSRDDVAKHGLLHTAKALGAGVRAFRVNARDSKEFAGVARTLTRVLFSVVLRRVMCAWRKLVFVSRWAIRNIVNRWRSQANRILHVWISAISYNRNLSTIAEWRAIERLELMQQGIIRFWRRLVRTSALARQHVLTSAFKQLKYCYRFGCYRQRLTLAMRQRRNIRVQRLAFSILCYAISRRTLIFMISFKLKSRVSKRIVVTYLRGWSSRCRRRRQILQGMQHRKLESCLRLCTAVLGRWIAAAQSSWCLDIKETRLRDSVCSCLLRVAFCCWIHFRALKCKVRYAHALLMAEAFGRWRDYIASVHSNSHRRNMIERRTNIRLERITFDKLDSQVIRKRQKQHSAKIFATFQSNLRARRMMRIWIKLSTYCADRRHELQIFHRLHARNRMTRQTQFVQCWWEKSRQTRLERNVIEALYCTNIIRRTLRAWMSALAMRLRLLRFTTCLVHKLKKAIIFAALRFTWNMWLDILARGQGLRHIVNVGISLRQSLVEESFRRLSLKVMLGNKQRVRLVHLEACAFAALNRLRQSRQSAREKGRKKFEAISKFVACSTFLSWQREMGASRARVLLEQLRANMLEVTVGSIISCWFKVAMQACASARRFCVLARRWSKHLAIRQSLCLWHVEMRQKYHQHLLNVASHCLNTKKYVWSRLILHVWRSHVERLQHNEYILRRRATTALKCKKTKDWYVKVQQATKLRQRQRVILLHQSILRAAQDHVQSVNANERKDAEIKDLKAQLLEVRAAQQLQSKCAQDLLKAITEEGERDACRMHEALRTANVKLLCTRAEALLVDRPHVSP